jgi:NADPH:quinone reductase-like Zn-dependent oxidoreductase
MRMATIPKTMRTAAIDRFGGPSVLKIHLLPTPTPGAGELLIAVHTAGVGSWDADIRGGWWPGPGRPKFPLVLGTDGSGTVVAVGSRVRRFKVGDRVYAYRWMNPKGGFYAQYVAVEAKNVARMPTTLTLREAGAIPVTGLTGLQGLEGALKIKKGERLIIHGASGGVGTVALQFANWLGARVLATASGKDGVALVRRLGADAAVDGRQGDIAEAAREFAPDGADAVLALSSGAALTQCLDALKPRGGRVAYPSGVEPAPRNRKGVKITAYDAVAGVREFQRLSRAVKGSNLRVVIADTFTLDDAAAAHERIEAGHVLGKVVFRVR